MLRINILGSGSSGNCTLVRCADTRVLVDAGLSARRICERLDALDVNPEGLSGILLTHEHGDHVRGVDVFCKKYDVPVFCNALTRESLQHGLRNPVQWRVAQAGSQFAVGDMDVTAFSVVHDAVDPMGFVISDGESRLGIVSDVGHVTSTVRSHLASIDTLLVEANYDPAMLQNDTKRPWSTKQRILSRHGHLSNAQTAELVAHCAPGGLRRVVLGHLSQDCNCPNIAISAINERLLESGYSDIDVHCAGADGLAMTLDVAIAPQDSVPPEVENSAERGAATVWVQPELF